MTTFKSSVEDWRSLVTQLANGKPIDFLLGWLNIESGGNPCDYTYLRESGIWQLEYPDNLTAGGTSEAGQHPVPPCVAWAGPSSCVKGGPCPARTIAYYSSLTSAQAYEQVRGGLAYVDTCVAKTDDEFATYGYNWDPSSSSYWSMVKFQHVVPAYIPKLLQYAIDQLGSPPPDWTTWRMLVESQLPGHSDWFDNAEKTGGYVNNDILYNINIDLPLIGTNINVDLPTWAIVGLGLATAVGTYFTYRHFKPKLQKRFPKLLS